MAAEDVHGVAGELVKVGSLDRLAPHEGTGVEQHGSVPLAYAGIERGRVGGEAR